MKSNNDCRTQIRP